MIEKNYVYELANGKKLTKNEFISYFENKVFKTIKTHNLIKQNEKICVALSGGKDSITTLFLLHKFLKKRNLEKNIFALLIDEGISNYREYTINFAKNFCKKLEVELNIQSYKKNFKTSQDENVKILKEKNKNISPCNICGTFRRALLNKFARELKADKIATGHNLDDESQTIMLNIFKNNFKISSRVGIQNGGIKNKLFIPRIKPLYFLCEKEVRIYTILKGFDVKYTSCPHSKDSFREEIGDILNKLEDKHKGVKNSIVNFFLEMNPNLKEKTKKKIETKLLNCEICNEPTEKKICKVCSMKKLVFK
jgi:uncharacterized protein (TIGR00269 family)